MVVYNNFSSTIEGDKRSADDCRLAKGVVMTIVLPHSSVSVTVGIRVLIGFDSEKLVRTICIGLYVPFVSYKMYITDLVMLPWYHYL